MKALVIIGPGNAEIREFTLPEIRDEEVLIKIKAVGICTFEQRFYKGGTDGYPFLGGHEICGVVEKIGNSVVNDLKVGDKVVVASLTRCGECYYCRKGMDHLCINSEDKKNYGIGGPGGFAEYIAVKGYEVYKVSDELDFAVGTVAEPIACVIRSIEMGKINFADSVVVLGAGIMGLIHVKLAKLRGAKVIVSEPDEARRKNALKAGADIVINPFEENLKEKIMSLTSNRGVEAVFYTAGGPKAVEEGITLLNKGGAFVLYGAVYPKVSISIDPNLIHYTEIIITGASKHTKESFLEAAEILASGLIEVNDLITEKFKLEDYDIAFERAMSQDTYRVVFEF